MKTQEIAGEISIIMPVIARRILLEFFETNDIPQTQLLTILAMNDVDGPCRLTDLSQQMRVTPPTMTGLIDRLERSGYAKRNPDSDDRRAINVDLTGKGKRLAQKFRSTVKAKWDELLSTLKKEDQEKFLTIMREIRANV